MRAIGNINGIIDVDVWILEMSCAEMHLTEHLLPKKGMPIRTSLEIIVKTKS